MTPPPSLHFKSFVIEGEKEFFLIAPEFADRMYVHGNIAKVHDNGLINYVGAETRIDGVPLDAVREYEHRKALKAAQEALDQAEEAGDERAIQAAISKIQSLSGADALLMAVTSNDNFDGGEDDDDDDESSGFFDNDTGNDDIGYVDSDDSEDFGL